MLFVKMENLPIENGLPLIVNGSSLLLEFRNYLTPFSIYEKIRNL